MDIRVGIKPAAVTDVETPLLVVNLFEGVTDPGGATGAVDVALGGQIRRLIADGEIRGEPATLTVIHNGTATGLRAQRVAVVGLGKQEEFDLEAARIAAATAARRAEALHLPSFATIAHGAGVGGLDPDEAGRVTLEACLLALYSYDHFK